MKKIMADVTAIRLAQEVLKSDPKYILGGASGEDAAKELADFIKTLSERLQADFSDMTNIPITDINKN